MAVVIDLPGVSPSDKDGHSAEFDRQLVVCLGQIKATLEQLDSLINTRRI